MEDAMEKGSNVKRVLGIVSLLLALSTFASLSSARAQDRAAEPVVRDPLVGAWRLVWLEEPGPDGKVHRPDCTGMFVFTSEGRASVQVMYQGPQATTATGPVQYAQGGYEASFGSYDLDETTHTFTYHVEGALVRSLVGRDLKRRYELSGNRLIIQSADPAERWRVAWEHY